MAGHKGRTGRVPRTPRTRGGADPDRDLNPQAGRDDIADPEERARQICLRLLTLAPRTRAQLAAALRKRGIPDDAADAVLDRFADVGLIDDAAVARAWVESRHYSRGLAGRALRAELKQAIRLRGTHGLGRDTQHPGRLAIPVPLGRT